MREKRRGYCVAVLFFFLLQFMPAGLFSPKPAAATLENIFPKWDGSGAVSDQWLQSDVGDTPANPCIITSARQFAGAAALIRTNSDYNGFGNWSQKHYKLSGDIDLDGIRFNQTADALEPSLDKYGPIGSAANPFKGTFDGNGFTVKNVTIGAIPDDYNAVGLFGELSGLGAAIKNLTVRNVEIVVRDRTGMASCAVGGLVGNASDAAVNNCFALDVKINVTATNADHVYGGGLIGIGGRVSNSHATGSVTVDVQTIGGPPDAGAHAGGLVGVSSLGVSNSSSACAVYAFALDNDAHAGGIVGKTAGSVIDSYATGDVSAKTGGANSKAFAGGIAGLSTKFIATCFSTGSITAESLSGSYAGGMVGKGNDGYSVGKSYATGDVTGKATAGTATPRVKVGGITGRSDPQTLISACYATGNVVAEGSATQNPDEDPCTSAGGISGHVSGGIEECYFYGNIQASNSSTGGFLTGGLAAYASADSTFYVERNVWNKYAGSGTSQDIAKNYQESAFAVIRKNISIDQEPYRQKTNFTAAPLGWDFSASGNWCYTDLDRRAKPHLRVFFDDNGSDVLNRVKPDLAWIGPPAVSVTSEDRETLRLTAGEYVPDAGSMTFSGLPMGTGVTIFQHPLSRDVLVVSCDSAALAWTGQIDVGYTVDGHTQLTQPFLLRVFPSGTVRPLQTELDILNAMEDIRSTGQNVGLFPATPASVGTGITQTLHGDASFDVVASTDLAVPGEYTAPFSSFASRVRLDGLTNGDVLALSYDIPIANLDLYGGWGALNQQERVNLLDSYEAVFAYGNRQKLVGAGGLLSIGTAVGSGIVVFTNTGVSIRFVFADSQGNAISPTGSVLVIQDGNADRMIRGGPVYFMTKHTKKDDGNSGGGGTHWVSVGSVGVSPEEYVLRTGEEIELSAIIRPANATNKGVLWVSSAPEVAVVDANGRVTGKRPDMAHITVTTLDGGKTATVTVWVVGDQPGTTVEIDLSGLGLENGILKLELGEEASGKILLSPDGSTLVASGLPEMLAFAADGRLTGKPLQPGAYTVILTVTAPDGTQRTETFLIEVKENEEKPTGKLSSGGGCNTGYLSFLPLGLSLFFLIGVGRRK